MKRKALLLIFTAALAFSVPAKAADVFLLGFSGFDYESPNPNGSVYLAVGEGYKAVGFVTSFGPLLDTYVDTGANEYTFYMFNLTVTGSSFVGGVLEVTFSPGRGRYYEDPRSSGTPAVYGSGPPNATSPSTFIDGSVAIGGSIVNMVLAYDFGANQGDFVGQMNLDEGSDLTYVPSGQRNGWHLGGLVGRPNTIIPAGYDNQIQGECRLPDATPTTTKTWGSLKALYR